MQTSTFGRAMAIPALALALLLSGGARAEEAPDEATVKRIKEAVIEELRESGWLDREIDAGIVRFIQRQQQARVEEERRQQDAANERARSVRPVSVERDHIRGNPDAEISLIEYSDFECPYCKRFHTEAEQLVAAFGGRVNWVYRHFPLDFHNPGAQKQAEASECAGELGGNEAFWRYTDAIYERTSSGGQGFPIASLVPLAVAQGLDEKAFGECLESERHAVRVQEDMREGIAAGVTGTPGNILRNNRTGEVLSRPGAVPFANLKADVEWLLN